MEGDVDKAGEDVCSHQLITIRVTTFETEITGGAEGRVSGKVKPGCRGGGECCKIWRGCCVRIKFMLNVRVTTESLCLFTFCHNNTCFD